MKRTLGALAMNWLRKPENQERIKSTARDVWGRFQEHRNARGTGRTDATDATERPPAASSAERDTSPGNRGDEQQ
jgi:hypothetical protein